MVSAGQARDWVLDQVRENVNRHGWSATGTATAAGTAYVYTTGLTATFGHPELVIAGLDPHTAHDLLRNAVEKIESGIPLEPGVPCEGIAAGFVVRFSDVFRPSCGLSLAVTDRFYGKPVPFRQLLWPDRRGRFPGEPGCIPGVASMQDIGKEAADG